jgi:hypothetical protein
MAEKEKILKGLGAGIYTIPSDPELIPSQSAQDSEGFISTDGQIELCRGRLLVGAEESGVNHVQGEGLGYTVSGTKIHFRKISTKIQYYKTSNSTWTDIVTGLTDGAEYTFSPYQSLAGTFMYATGADGIYKICTANPASYVSCYDANKNYKGYSLITQSRMSMWNVPGSLTTHYMSYTDSAQDSTVYNTITGEATAAATSGTLAFKTATFTVTIASPALFTMTNHGFRAGDMVTFTTTGALPTGLTVGTKYYVITSGLTANTFAVSTTVGGSAVNTSGTQSGTHSVAGVSARTCFNVRITITGSGELFTDNYEGVLTGSLGGTGTINYATGAWTLSTSSAGTATYSWENSNYKGLTDFGFSATRTALQGDVVHQDEGGDAILNIVFHEGSYYSFKESSVYRLTIASTGLTFENIVFRKNIGLPYWRAVLVTSKGIMFMDTSNYEKPQLTILQPNITGDNLEPVTLATQFDFSNYVWDNCAMGTYGEFVVFSGKTPTSTYNNKLFMYNVRRNTVDILPYTVKTISSDAGTFYIGDSISSNIYELLSGFDDNGELISGYWISNDEKFGGEHLKKVKRLRIKGIIAPEQILEVYESFDNDGFYLVGTIRGDGSYVDTSAIYPIGNHGIGTAVVGGERDYADGGFYLAELKLKTPKFRKRTIKLVPTGMGYVSVNMLDDFDIRTFQQRLPSKYRSKQDVSLDGTLTNQ